MKISPAEPTIEIEASSLPPPEKQTKNFQELMQEKGSSSPEEDQESFSLFTPSSQERLLEETEELPKERSSSRLSSKEKKKEGKPRDETQPSLPLFSTPYLSASSLPNTSVEPTSQGCPPEIFAFMEKVASEMIVMTSEKSMKTTLILDKDVFGSTLLKEAEITIEEFSSAPKIFNVKITASPEAIARVRGHIEEFLKLFQERKFGFSINRIDTELSTSKPVFSRKESTGEESSSDQQGSDRQ